MAPHVPTMVLFEPTVTSPVIVPGPCTKITRAVLPEAWLLSADNVVTTTGVRLPPPVVPVPQPTSVGGAGSTAHEVLAAPPVAGAPPVATLPPPDLAPPVATLPPFSCLLYTSDAADEEDSVD